MLRVQISDTRSFETGRESGCEVLTSECVIADSGEYSRENH